MQDTNDFGAICFYIDAGCDCRWELDMTLCFYSTLSYLFIRLYYTLQWEVTRNFTCPILLYIFILLYYTRQLHQINAFLSCFFISFYSAISCVAIIFDILVYLWYSILLSYSLLYMVIRPNKHFFILLYPYSSCPSLFHFYSALLYILAKTWQELLLLLLTFLLIHFKGLTDISLIYSILLYPTFSLIFILGG